jgi:hypothetical protein
MIAIARTLALFTCLAACTSLPAADTRADRPVSGFTAISLSAPLKLELVQGDTESLSLEGDATMISELETVIEDHTLKIRTKPNSSFHWGNTKVRGKVTARNIEALRISG